MTKRSRTTKVEKLIYIKYGELTLKGKNRREFVQCLFNNVKKALAEFKSIQIIKQYDSMTITHIAKAKYDKVFNIMKAMPGISFVIEGYGIERDENKLHAFLKTTIENKKQTFKVITKRADKKYPVDSMEFSRQLGGFILKNFKNLSVDIHKPELKVNVEIKEDKFIVYFNRVKGCGGFPLGINGRVLMLISGGIDSPVAASLLMKKGFHVDFLTFVSPPHTSKEAENKVRSLIKQITLDGKLEKPILYICKFTDLQHEIAHITNHSYQITIMRRYFFRIAQHLVKTQHYDAMATGESLGQVASQTIESMTTISSVLDNVVVLRPLLTYDKIEIINLAEKLNTYNISILPYPDACSMFVPANPTTKPNLAKAEQLEKELMLIDTIYKRVLAKHIKREFI
ncbi:MAG: tRNA 4-thiouridine(8) synthase ThiI [Mycoplasmoidaceae bacterium]|nr:tRNA 4-thiouridine(8) synthase ThiI [Mycoplasmoidaceae bacterium]